VTPQPEVAIRKAAKIKNPHLLCFITKSSYPMFDVLGVFFRIAQMLD